jgi:hypothetical protein
MTLFRQISIWKHLGDGRAVRFNCIEDMTTHKFAAQTADLFTLPIKSEHVSYLDRLFSERFIEVEPTERKWFDSIEEAVAALLNAD